MPKATATGHHCPLAHLREPHSGPTALQFGPRITSDVLLTNYNLSSYARPPYQGHDFCHCMTILSAQATGYVQVNLDFHSAVNSSDYFCHLYRLH